MIKHKRVEERCETCKQVTKVISSDRYSCDECGALMHLDTKGEQDFLDLTVFHNKKPTRTIQCCSWECILKKVRRVRTDYFISLPFILFDGKVDGCRAKDFFAAINKAKP